MKGTIQNELGIFEVAQNESGRTDILYNGKKVLDVNEHWANADGINAKIRKNKSRVLEKMKTVHCS